MGCHSLLQRIFSTQGSNPGLLHCRQTLPSELPGTPLVIIQCYFVLCSDCSSLQLAPVALWHSHDCMFLKNSFWSTSLVSSGTKCSMLILYISYHSLSWQIDGETIKTVGDFILEGSKITADGDCNHEIKRHLLLGRKADRDSKY